MVRRWAWQMVTAVCSKPLRLSLEAINFPFLANNVSHIYNLKMICIYNIMFTVGQESSCDLAGFLVFDLFSRLHSLVPARAESSLSISWGRKGLFPGSTGLAMFIFLKPFLVGHLFFSAHKFPLFGMWNIPCFCVKL